MALENKLELYVKDIMSPDPFCVQEDARMSDVVIEMSARGIASAVVVSKKRRLRGIVTAKEVIDSRGRRNGIELIAEATVAECMIEDPTSVSPTDDIERVARYMDQLQVDHLPVEEGNRVVGIVSQGDVLKAVSMELKALADDKPS